MPTKILRPGTIASQNAWTLGAGASKPAAVDPGDPISHDDDTTYITKNETNGSDSYFPSAASIPGGIGAVNTVSMASRARILALVAGNSMSDFIRLSGSNTAGNTYALAGTTYVTMGPTSLARPGGGTWQAADLPIVEMAIQSTASAAATFRCTSLWLVVDYTLAGGGFKFLCSVLAPLIGAGLTWGQFRAVVGYALRDTQFSPDELRHFWREWVAYSHPVSA